ncbi:MAG: MlaD family protein [Thermodesulfobacteriota bacterium]|nr:MlaD family protein [Thermodesulfobacteriota bacterium]
MFDMKKELRWSKLKVGSVITMALLALLTAIFFAGKMEKIFSPKIDLKIQFQDVKGLRKGAPVWIFGTEVGSVKAIYLDPVLGAVVTISVNKNVQGFIRKDAQASILTMGLLGDKYVELNTGSPNLEPIQRGETIKGVVPVEFSEIMETAGVSIGKIGDFIKKLDSLLERIETGKGTLAKFLTDPSIYDNINRSVRTLSLILEEIKGSRGTLKMLVEDPSLYQRMVSAVSSVEEFSRKLNESPGTLKKLLEDPSLYQKTVSAVSSIEEFARKVNESKGTLNKLVEDPSLYDKTLATVSSIEQLTKNIEQISQDIEKFSKGLNEKTGTLKRIVDDPSLYDNLNQSSAHLSSILKRIDQGEGLAGALLHDKELANELKGTIAELKELMRDIKDHPKKYFKFSIF